MQKKALVKYLIKKKYFEPIYLKNIKIKVNPYARQVQILPDGFKMMTIKLNTQDPDKIIITKEQFNANSLRALVLELGIKNHTSMVKIKIEKIAISINKEIKII